MTNFSKWLTVSPWEASESRGAAPPAEPWSLGSSGRQSLTSTCRTTAGGAPGGRGPCPHVWPARPQTRTGVLVKIPAYALTSLSHGLEARVQDQSAVDSVSGESPLPGRSVPPSGCTFTGPGPGACTHGDLQAPPPQRALTHHGPPSRPPLTPPTFRGSRPNTAALARVHHMNLGNT